jgi:hypothetical protein
MGVSWNELRKKNRKLLTHDSMAQALFVTISIPIWFQKINFAELHVLNQNSKVQLAGLGLLGNTKIGFASCEN